MFPQHAPVDFIMGVVGTFISVLLWGIYMRPFIQGGEPSRGLFWTAVFCSVCTGCALVQTLFEARAKKKS